MDHLESKKVALLQQLRGEKIGKDKELSTEPEDQHAPTLDFLGRKVESIAKKEDAEFPTRSGASVFLVPPDREKLGAIINTAEAQKRAFQEPVASVLEKIVTKKGIQPIIYGEEESQQSLIDAENAILDLVMEHGAKPLFHREDGSAEQGVFVIPGKGLVFVEEYSKDLAGDKVVEDLSDVALAKAEDLSKYKKYEAVKAANPDLELPAGDNPFSNEYAIKTKTDPNWALEKKEEELQDQEDATKTVSLDIRRQEMQKMLFKNDPGKIYRITAFLQDEPIQAEQLMAPATAQVIPPIEPINTLTSDQSPEANIPTFKDQQFVPVVATNFTWAPEATQGEVTSTPAAMENNPQTPEEPNNFLGKAQPGEITFAPGSLVAAADKKDS